jgi:hypothetical protein
MELPAEINLPSYPGPVPIRGHAVSQWSCTTSSVAMVSSPFKWLCAVGFVLLMAGWALFFLMALEVNRALPPGRRISLLRLGYQSREIWRLHEELLPAARSRRTASLLLMYAAGALWAAAVLLEIRPSS